MDSTTYTLDCHSLGNEFSKSRSSPPRSHYSCGKKNSKECSLCSAHTYDSASPSIAKEVPWPSQISWGGWDSVLIEFSFIPNTRKKIHPREELPTVPHPHSKRLYSHASPSNHSLATLFSKSYQWRCSYERCVSE